MSAAPVKAQEGELIPRGEIPNTPGMRAIRRLEAAIPLALPEVDFTDLTFHHFCAGVYIRQLTVPAGVVLVGKVHKEENFFLLVKGEMTVLGDSGQVIRVKAPFMIVTQPGTKRVGFAHEECIVLNIHPNPDNEKDPDKLEEKFIIPEAKPTLPARAEKILLERKTQ